MVAADGPLVEQHAASLWAKSTTADGKWQPLWVHLLDVGAVARALLEHWLTAPARRSLARGLGLGQDDALGWCAGLAALHDLGKATPHFQRLSDRDVRRLAGAGLHLPPRVTSSLRHDELTAALLPEALMSCSGLSDEVCRKLARLLGGHHGRFHDPPSNLARRVTGDETWLAARVRITRRTLATLGVPTDAPPVRFGHDAAARLLGLTIVADWLASAPEVCSYRAAADDSPPALAPEERIAEVDAELSGRLRQLGFTAPSRRDRARGFGELFPRLEPRAGQRIVDRLASALEQPGLLLVEDATGSGKTEAAFVIVERALAALGARGAIVALPTRATSDQAFRRLRAFLGVTEAGGAELHLVHGSAAMSVDYEALRHAAPMVAPRQVYDDDGNSGLRASAWFAQRRRGLLATFAVGTIDQALLAVLPVRHHALRLAALADRVVVLDEVHAYDTYMSTLLERLLEWLGALSTTVVLLTATLPANKRARLLCAYARGAGLEGSAVPAVPYPRVIGLSPGGASAVPIKGERSAHCELELIKGGRPERPLGPIACAAITRAVDAGGCVAVVMNTVARAQAAYRELSDLVERGRLRLLHARFRFRERDRIEREVVQWYGPPVTGWRPQRAVLVATQVIEQSLDIDFDLLVSDLAPVDLLLQRRGRLHRHMRVRPSQLASPRMLVLADEHGGAPRLDPGSRAVYAPHVLLRTWLALREHGSDLATPEDVEGLIERVYGPAQPPPDPQLRALWERTQTDLEAELETDERRARAVRIPAPGAAEAFYERPFTDASDEESSADLRAATRLGESASVVILEAEERELADQSLSPATVRALLERSVSLRSRPLVHALRQLEPPPAWQRHALLYEHRLLQLDEAGRWSAPPGLACEVGIRLDPELGVVLFPN